jgi:hypothetical protein
MAAKVRPRIAGPALVWGSFPWLRLRLIPDFPVRCRSRAFVTPRIDASAAHGISLKLKLKFIFKIAGTF